MNTLKTVYLSILLMMVLISGCTDSETINPDPNQCYEGLVIAGDCPSFLFVQVSNAPIGENWELIHNYDLYEQATYNNAISINNIHQFTNLDLQVGDKVYFTIDTETSKDPNACLKSGFCTTDIRFLSYPNKRYCISTISKQPCAENN
jgi:hypothetical protein